jgi:hypothetical protein
MGVDFEDRKKGLRLVDGCLALKDALPALPGSEGFGAVMVEKPEGGYTVDHFFLRFPPSATITCCPPEGVEEIYRKVSCLVEERFDCTFGRHLLAFQGNNGSGLRLSFSWDQLEQTVGWFYTDCFGEGSLEADRARVVQEELQESLEPGMGETRSPHRL